MQVFIMRHGEAEAKADTDALRPLTSQGQREVSQMADTYAEALQDVDVIWASPYVRAQQTAELMAVALSKPVVTQDFLPPNGHPGKVLDTLTDSQEETVLIISHQPLVGILVDGLGGLEPGRYRMGTGALACLKTDVYANNCCELLWLHQPTGTQPICE